MYDDKMTNKKLWLFQMRDGASVAVSLKTVGYVTVSVLNLRLGIMEALYKDHDDQDSVCLNADNGTVW